MSEMMCCCLSAGFDLTRFLVTVRCPAAPIYSRSARGRGSQPRADGRQDAKFPAM